MATYKEMDGRPLKEIFLHTHSGINAEEYRGFQRALPEGIWLVAIRVRQERGGMRSYRHDDHPEAGQRGKHPVQRGVFWQRNARHGLLYTNGFKARIATYASPRPGESSTGLLGGKVNNTLIAVIPPRCRQRLDDRYAPDTVSSRSGGDELQPLQQCGRRPHFAKSRQCVEKRRLKAEMPNAYTAPPALQDHLGAISA